MSLFRSVETDILSVLLALLFKFCSNYNNLRERNTTLPFTAYRYSIFLKPTQIYCQVTQLIVKTPWNSQTRLTKAMAWVVRISYGLTKTAHSYLVVWKIEILNQPRTTSTFLHVTNPTPGWGDNVLLASEIWNSESVASSSPTWPLSRNDCRVVNDSKEPAASTFRVTHQLDYTERCLILEDWKLRNWEALRKTLRKPLQKHKKGLGQLIWYSD